MNEVTDSLHKRTIKGQNGQGDKSASKQRKDTRTSEPRGDTEPNADRVNADENKSKNERERWKDPLHWFGLLPPLSLRTAQKEFKSGTKLCFVDVTLLYPDEALISQTQL